MFALHDDRYIHVLGNTRGLKHMAICHSLRTMEDFADSCLLHDGLYDNCMQRSPTYNLRSITADSGIFRKVCYCSKAGSWPSPNVDDV